MFLANLLFIIIIIISSTIIIITNIIMVNEKNHLKVTENKKLRGKTIILQKFSIKIFINHHHHHYHHYFHLYYFRYS